MVKYLKPSLLIILLSFTIGFAGCKKVSYLNDKGQDSRSSIVIEVPIIAQKPELDNGCEVTSLAMLLDYAGVNVSKMTLAEEIKKDETLPIYDEEGKILEWGNPSKGFVGDITGENIGFGVYTEPMMKLMNEYLPGRAIDLSHEPFERLLRSIDERKPVIVWVTSEFKVPEEYIEWESEGQTIRVTFDEHAVLLVGYDEQFCYVNNPYNSEKNQKVEREVFIEVWESMGSMAISYH